MRLVHATYAVLLAGTASVAVAQTAATPAVPASAAAPSPAAGDRPEKTPGGVTLTAPAGWTSKTGPTFIELAAPESDLRLAVVDVGTAADARAAALAAWQAWHPAQTRAPKLVTARPPRNGWEDRQLLDYEVSPNERRVLVAMALRKGTGWTVMLADGSEATAEKRGAALGLKCLGWLQSAFRALPEFPAVTRHCPRRSLTDRRA